MLLQWQVFCDGGFGGEVFSPARLQKSPAVLQCPHVRVNAAFSDFGSMLLQQLEGVSRALAAGSGSLPDIRTNYGTGIMPSLFGADLLMMEDAHDTL